MKYELALKLKEAGFPQKGDGIYVGDVGNLGEEDFSPGGVVGMAQEDFYYIPNLSDLIEEIGEDFDRLDRDNNGIFTALGKYYCCDLHGEGRYITCSPDPTEAVAEVYLALHPPRNIIKPE